MSDGFTRIITHFFRWLFVLLCKPSGKPLSSEQFSPYFHYSYSVSIHCSWSLLDEFARVFRSTNIQSTLLDRASSFDHVTLVSVLLQVVWIDASSLESRKMDANFGFRRLLFLANGAVHLLQWWMERSMLRTIYFSLRTKWNRDTPR